ncbi:MAG: LysR family transcriptional regulator [Solobacterium sp.]|nr:LysR family transcriptional regulator [Solobacterium sp.]
MLNQLRYYQAVVQCRSFTEAAEKCHISQSAISQQIQSLEQELGVQLIKREKRKFDLTPAGEFFYRKSIILLADYENLVRETQRIGHDDVARVRIGYLLTYGGEELQLAVSDFSTKYPEVDIRIMTGNHEELFDYLRLEGIDIAMSDQRRVFSNSYNNVILRQNRCYVEIARENPLAALSELTADDLKNLPCIIVASKGQEGTESKYYSEIFGIRSEYLYAPTIKDARLMVVSGRGYMVVEGQPVLSHFDATIARLPFYSGSVHFERNLCLFWKKDNSGYYIEEFADLLMKRFGVEEEESNG